MNAIRTLTAALVLAVAAPGAPAADTKPKPIVGTPCDRHDLGPKFPPIKIPPVALPKPGPVARPVVRPK